MKPLTEKSGKYFPTYFASFYTQSSTLRAVTVAVLSVIGAVLLMVLMWNVFNNEAPRFLFFIAAVVVSAVYGGLRAGLLTTFLSLLILGLVVLPPYHSFNVDISNWLLLGVFLLVSGGISYLEEQHRKGFREWHRIFNAEQVARQQAEQALNQLSRLQQVSEALAQAVSMEDVARIILQQAETALGAATGNVQLFHAEDETIEMLYTTSRLPAEQLRPWRRFAADPAYPMTDVIHQKKALWFSSAEECTALYPAMEAVSRNNSGAAVLLPPVVGGQAFGALNLTFTERKTFSEQEQSLMLALTRQSAQALERARLYDAEREARDIALHHAERLAHLQDLTAAFAQAHTAHEVAAIVIEQGLDILGAHIGSISFVSQDGQRLELLDGKTLLRELLENVEYMALNFPGPAQQAIRTKAPVWIENVEEYYRRFPEVAAVAQKKTGTEAVACLPLIVSQRAIGVIGISFPKPHPMDENEREFLLAIASQCAQTLERIQFYERAKEMSAAQERQRLARDLHDSVTQTLFSASMLAENIVRSGERAPERALLRMQQVHDLTKGAMAEMRALLLELRPEALEKTPLEDLCRQLADAVKGRKEIQVTLDLQLENNVALPPPVHTAFYRIAQEALNNVVKHSKATQVTISLILLPHRTELCIADNGVGFDREHLSAGIGMGSMHERAEAIGATLEIVKPAEGGTKVTLVWTNDRAV